MLSEISHPSKALHTAAIGFCLIAFLGGSASAQIGAQQVSLAGTVRDTSGAAIPSAIVESMATNPSVSAATGADGRFTLKIASPPPYKIRVSKQGFKPRLVEVASADAANKEIAVVLELGSGNLASSIDFSDSPNFTVAGVTDWSNVGLHGSDANVKTSEALTKDAAGLKSSTGSAPGGSEADAHRILGDEKEENGDPVAAEHEYELAVKLDPSEQNYFSWGAQLLLHRAGVAATEVLTKAAALHPKSQRMIEALGAAFYANGQYTEAAQQMCRAAELNPGDPEPYLFLGRIEESATDGFPCSEQTLRRFASEQPKNPDANFYYGVVSLKSARRSQREDDFERAESSFRKALANRPSFGEVYVQLGLLYNARGKRDAALLEFQNAARVAPRLADAHYQLSLGYRRAGDAPRADEEMKKYEELHRAEEAALEKERREMKQFVTILQQSSPKH